MSRYTISRDPVAKYLVGHAYSDLNADNFGEIVAASLQNAFPGLQFFYEDQALAAFRFSGNVSSSSSRELPHREDAEQEVQELRLQNERLKSLATQERRAYAREAQRYDQLCSQYRELQAIVAEMQAQLNERAHANDVLQNVLIARLDAQLRMFESYEGVVKHADKDQVVVVYEVEDDLVEQTYVAKQFIAGELPKPGDCLAVSVQVVQIPEVPASHDAQDPLDEDDDHDVVPLPREF